MTLAGGALTVSLEALSPEASILEGTRSYEAGLVARVAAGDRDAFDELYDQLGPAVRGRLRAQVGDPGVAEEICQDTFHAIWRSAATYRPDRGAPRGWIFRIARNAALDWYRTVGRRAQRERGLPEALPAPESGSVEEAAIASAEALRVRDLVLELPRGQRECLRLMYWGGYSQSEIAALTGVPLGTVKSRVRSALRKLRGRVVAD